MVVEVAQGALRAEVIARVSEATLQVRFPPPGIYDLLERYGEVPLPPYIKRTADDGQRAVDRDRYQTVYARHPGAVAAPTAGLHFTPELLTSLQQQGVRRATVTLHVGWGTFQPVRVTDVQTHRMAK
jgi:S-adenosylmethionine:tRNA ribosyltransferase-isomerase